MPYIPHTEDDVREMLARIGAKEMEELWAAVPEKARLRRPLNLPKGLGESEVVKQVRGLAGRNREAGQLVCFLGGGTYWHHVPAAVDHLLSRSEFYTAYTPYQPEISQGTLQAIFEFQTMICELLGMEVANASMYDGAEATAEAALMAERLRPKNEEGALVLCRSVNPRYRRTLRTYLVHSSRLVQEVPFDDSGQVDLAVLRKQLAGALALVIQHPNYFGCLEPMPEIAEICRESGALLIVVVTEPIGLGLLEPPGSFGADLVVGEGQSLGIPMGFGGPHLGLFAGREEYARKMPGRLVGETVDREGRRGFVLTLATREQHIRRAKATSNICTNQGLLALAAAIYLTLLGPGGLAELAAVNRGRAETLKENLRQAGAGKIRFSAAGFNEFVLDLGRPPEKILSALLGKGILGGIPLGAAYPELANAILVTTTEMTGPDDLERYAADLAEILHEA